MVSGNVTAIRKDGDLFVATCLGRELTARFVLLATGLVDHCPAIEGQQVNCPSDVIRFCPICDGYEAIDLRVGVLGSLETGGKKALFLATYTKLVSLFLTDDPSENASSGDDFANANVTIVGKVKRIRQHDEDTIAVETVAGATMWWTFFTPLWIAPFAPISPSG